MCGRYTLHAKAREIAERFNVQHVPASVPENYNVAPGQIMPVIIQQGASPRMEMMRWGLIPTWAKDIKIGYKLINARDDSIFDKPIWRRLVLRRRALVPADGFYEWKRPPSPRSTNEHKQPFYIRPRTRALFAFAGLWDTWLDTEGIEWKTFAIVTTEPNREMAAIHNRMPVILYPEDEATWLNPDITTREDIEPLLHPYHDDGLELFPVSDQVNVTRNNDARLIYPINSQ